MSKQEIADLKEAVLNVTGVVARLLREQIQGGWNPHWNEELEAALDRASELTRALEVTGDIPSAFKQVWHDRDADMRRIWALGAELRSLGRRDPERVRAEAEETLDAVRP